MYRGIYRCQQNCSTLARSSRTSTLVLTVLAARGSTNAARQRSNGPSFRPSSSCSRWSSHASSKVWSKTTRTRSNKAPTPDLRRRERGTSALEFSIIAPVFLLLIFVIIQAGLYFHARNTAQSASREGVSYLRLAGNNSDPNAFIAAAEDVTEGYASKIGRLKNVTAVGTIDTKTGRVTMLVTGQVVLPVGGDVQIQQSSEATLEQFRGDTRE